MEAPAATETRRRVFGPDLPREKNASRRALSLEYCFALSASSGVCFGGGGVFCGLSISTNISCGGRSRNPRRISSRRQCAPHPGVLRQRGSCCSCSPAWSLPLTLRPSPWRAPRRAGRKARALRSSPPSRRHSQSLRGGSLLSGGETSCEKVTSPHAPSHSPHTRATTILEIKWGMTSCVLAFLSLA